MSAQKLAGFRFFELGHVSLVSAAPQSASSRSIRLSNRSLSQQHPYSNICFTA